MKRESTAKKIAPIINDNDIHPRNSVLNGHKDWYTRLCDIFDNGKLHHAILIDGKKGIGKATFIYSFIKEMIKSTSKNNSEQDNVFERTRIS